MIVPIANEPLRAALLQEVEADPSVAMVAASSAGVDGRLGVTTVDALAETADEPSRARRPPTSSRRRNTSTCSESMS